MGGTLSPSPWFTGLDENGDPISGGLLFTYASGTSTKLSVYTDAALTVPHANPLVLDSAGRAVLYLAPGEALKYVLAPAGDSDPPLTPIKTVDPVGSVPASSLNTDIDGVAGENINDRQSVYLSDGSAGQTAGRWYMTDADNHYSAAGAKAIGRNIGNVVTGESITIRIAGTIPGSGLTAGAVYYASSTPGGMTTTVPAQGKSLRVIGVADSTTSLLLAEKAKAETRDRVAAMLTSVGNVGAGEDTLFEYIAPAGELALDGMGYHGKFWGATANNANAKTLSVRVIEGANNTVLVAFAFTVSELGEWVLEFDVLRSAAATYNYTCGARVGIANGPTSRVGDNNDTGSPATWANAVTIRVTGSATTTNDILAVGGYIRLQD